MSNGNDTWVVYEFPEFVGGPTSPVPLPTSIWKNSGARLTWALPEAQGNPTWRVAQSREGPVGREEVWETLVRSSVGAIRTVESQGGPVVMKTKSEICPVST